MGSCIKRRVLLVCVENSDRSQMAEAFARKFGGDVIEPASAGTHPASRVSPTVVDVMKERQIDLSTRTPQLLTTRLVEEADLIITMGCSVKEVCPAPMVKHSIDWKLEDPSCKSIDEVRRIRDEVERKVRELVDSLRPGKSQDKSEHQERFSFDSGVPSIALLYSDTVSRIFASN
mgnify:CR=1 FL=1